MTDVKNLLKTIDDSKKAIFEYFGVKSWHSVTIDDNCGYYWRMNDRDSLEFWDEKPTCNDQEAEYLSETYKGEVYEREDYTMALLVGQSFDGNYYAIYDNAKRIIES